MNFRQKNHARARGCSEAESRTMPRIAALSSLPRRREVQYAYSSLRPLDTWVRIINTNNPPITTPATLNAKTLNVNKLLRRTVMGGGRSGGRAGPGTTKLLARRG